MLRLLQRVNVCRLAAVQQQVSLLSTSARHLSADELSQVLKDRIQGYVNSDKVVVFMKGTPDQPMCGFSRNVKMV